MSRFHLHWQGVLALLLVAVVTALRVTPVDVARRMTARAMGAGPA